MTAFAYNALRTFDNELAPLLKGISLAKLAPLLLVALVAFFIFKIFFLGADSKFTPYARSLGLTAANLWDNRNNLGLSPSIRGRTLESMEPLTEVLDALTNAVRKYESHTPNSFQVNSNSKVRFE